MILTKCVSILLIWELLLGIYPVPRIPAFCNSAIQRRTMSYDIDDFRIGNDKAVIQEKINCPMLGTGKHVCGGWFGGRWLNTTFVFSKTQA